MKRISWFIKRLLLKVAAPFVRWFQFAALRTYTCYGDPRRLHFGKHLGLANTLFNVASGDIYIGDETIFGHNCMVLSGVHEFVEGRRKSLVVGGGDTPQYGKEIRIGRGCWIASGVIVQGGVTIGDNVIVGAGSVVTKDLPSGVFAVGIPATIKKSAL